MQNKVFKTWRPAPSTPLGLRISRAVGGNVLNHLSTQTRGPKSQKFFRKVFRTMRYVQKSCQKWRSKIFSVFSNLTLTFHLRMLSVHGVQNSISQPILHPKRGSCLLLASWIPLGESCSWASRLWRTWPGQVSGTYSEFQLIAVPLKAHGGSNLRFE